MQPHGPWCCLHNLGRSQSVACAWVPRRKHYPPGQGGLCWGFHVHAAPSPRSQKWGRWWPMPHSDCSQRHSQATPCLTLLTCHDSRSIHRLEECSHWLTMPLPRPRTGASQGLSVQHTAQLLTPWGCCPAAEPLRMGAGWEEIPHAGLRYVLPSTCLLCRDQCWGPGISLISKLYHPVGSTEANPFPTSLMQECSMVTGQLALLETSSGVPVNSQGCCEGPRHSHSCSQGFVIPL